MLFFGVLPDVSLGAVFSWWLWGWKALDGLTRWLLAGPPQSSRWPFSSGSTAAPLGGGLWGCFQEAEAARFLWVSQEPPRITLVCSVGQSTAITPDSGVGPWASTVREGGRQREVGGGTGICGCVSALHVQQTVTMWPSFLSLEGAPGWRVAHIPLCSLRDVAFGCLTPHPCSFLMWLSYGWLRAPDSLACGLHPPGTDRVLSPGSCPQPRGDLGQLGDGLTLICLGGALEASSSLVVLRLLSWGGGLRGLVS